MKKTKLNLGCGFRKKDGYLNIDLNEECSPDLIANALKLPIKKGSIEEVFSKHFMEHFSPKEALDLFREMNRILKLGGKLHFVVDCDKNLETLKSKDPTHKHRYSLAEIRKLCDSMGFSVITLEWITYKSKKTLNLIRHKKNKIRLIAAKVRDV